MKCCTRHDPRATAAQTIPSPNHPTVRPPQDSKHTSHGGRRTAISARPIYPPAPDFALWFGWLQERKKELGSIQGELEARRAAFVEREKESKRREAELEGRLAVVQAQLSEVQAAAARDKEEQLEAVLAGSQAVSVMYPDLVERPHICLVYTGNISPNSKGV